MSERKKIKHIEAERQIIKDYEFIIECLDRKNNVFITQWRNDEKVVREWVDELTPIKENKTDIINACHKLIEDNLYKTYPVRISQCYIGYHWISDTEKVQYEGKNKDWLSKVFLCNDENYMIRAFENLPNVAIPSQQNP